MNGLHLHANATRTLLVVGLVLLTSLGGWAQPGGGPGPGNERLTADARAVADALEKQNTIRWQGMRVFAASFDASNQAADQLLVQDGFDPTNPRAGYFFTQPRAFDGTAVVPGSVKLADTWGPLPIPWDGGLPRLMRRPGVAGHFQDMLGMRLGHFEITNEGTAAVAHSQLKGTAYSIKPRYRGGWVKLIVDQQSGLPAQVERYGVDDTLRYRSSYQTLETRPASFWFAEGLANPRGTNRPPSIGMRPPPPPDAGPPPEGEPQRDRPIANAVAEQLIRRFDMNLPDKLLPGGFMPAQRELIQAQPFPIIQLVFSDGLNPVSFFIARLPEGMVKDSAMQRRVQERLDQLKAGPRGNIRKHLRGNWVFVATGEVEDGMLDKALSKATMALTAVSGNGETADGGGRRGQGGPGRRPPMEKQ